MALRKCPKCEVNYLRPNETLCPVCASAMKKKRQAENEEETVMCINCGEAPAVKGHDLCEDCLREQKRQADLELMADKVRADEAGVPLEEDISEDEEEEE